MSNELFALTQLVPGIAITPTSLTMPPTATAAHYEQAFKACWTFRDTIQMWIADLLNQAEERFGEGWVQICASATGRSAYTVENWRSVYRHIPAYARLPGVAHSKHVEVAVLRSPDLQQRILEVARDNELPTDEVRTLAQKFKVGSYKIQSEAANLPDAAFLEILQEEGIPFSEPESNPLYTDGGPVLTRCPHCGGTLS